MIPKDDGTILSQLYEVLLERKTADPNRSYVAQLYSRGRDQILKKVGEEATEAILAAKNQNRDAMIHETADLLFHILVMLAEQDLHPDHVFGELQRRFNQSRTPPAPTGTDRREYNRRLYSRPITLQFHSGMTLQGITQDVSITGLLVSCAFEPKWQLIGETGFFELFSGPHVHTFSFEVARITDYCLGLNIIRDRGLFGFVLAKEAFQDLFTEPAE